MATFQFSRRIVSFALRSAAVVAMLLVTAVVASADPIALSTPSGLNVGDKFRFLFITGSFTDAMSADIADYNTFVQGQAGGATYDGAAVNWKAIGSTATIDARDNVGGFGSEVPIYLPSGIKIFNGMTTTGTGMWSGSLLALPTETIDSTTIPDNAVAWAFTGSNVDGTKNTSFTNLVLGSSPSVATGRPDTFGSYNGDWISVAIEQPFYSLRMYAVSEELTVAVPEPSTYAMALAGVAYGGLSIWRRRLRRVGP